MVIGRRAVALGIEGRVDKADVGQQALRDCFEERQCLDWDPECVGVAGREGMPEREVLEAPEGHERKVAEEVSAGWDPLGVRDWRELIPDRGQGRDRGVVVVAVRPSSMLIEAVWERLAGKRAEVPV